MYICPNRIKKRGRNRKYNDDSLFVFFVVFKLVKKNERITAI